MDRIERTHSGLKRVFPVYTTAEANAEGIDYRHWREAKPPQWGLSDDGYVAQCLGVRVFVDNRGRPKILLTYPYGRIWVTRKANLYYLERKYAGNFSGSSARSWQDIESRKIRTKNIIRAYVQQVMLGKGIDYETLGRMYRSDQKIPAATVRRLLKQRVIQQMIDDEMSRVMAGNGLTPELGAEAVHKAYELAKERKDAGALLAVAKFLVKHHVM